jgi:hypothetical protein
MAPGDRHCGLTSGQMKAAPAGEFFVWCNGDLRYPKALAANLGRSDLRIVSPDEVRFGCLYGHRGSVLVDHAAELTPETWREIHRTRG